MHYTYSIYPSSEAVKKEIPLSVYQRPIVNFKLKVILVSLGQLPAQLSIRVVFVGAASLPPPQLPKVELLVARSAILRRILAWLPRLHLKTLDSMLHHFL